MSAQRDSVIEALCRLVDEPMARRGFARTPRSLVYRRDLPGVRHELEITLGLRPRFHPSSDIHLQFGFRVEIPALTFRLKEMGVAEPVGLPAVSGSYELLIPKPVPMFFVEKGEPVDHGVCELLGALERHALPFLDRLDTPAGLVTVYERSRPDRRDHWRGVHAFVGKHTYARTALVAIDIGRPDIARTIVELELNGLDAQATYAPLVAAIGLARRSERRPAARDIAER
jgi:hypothetical protein